MSFFSVNGELLRDTWPDFIGRRLVDDLQLDNAQEWQLIPENPDDLYNWASVIWAGTDSTGSVCHKLVYAPSGQHPEGNQRFEVRVRVQGFVASQSVGPLGDWNGSNKTCARAHQRLVLHGGPHHELFATQAQALAGIRDMVLTVLKTDPSTDRVPTSQIELKRSVFTKVTARNVQTLTSALRMPQDDPNEEARAVSRQWIVDHRIGCYMEDEAGLVVEATHFVIRPGDFVDAAATVQCRTRYNRGKKRTEVNFILQDLFRLKSKAELQELNIDAALTDTDTPDVVEVQSVPSGY